MSNGKRTYPRGSTRRKMAQQNVAFNGALVCWDANLKCWRVLMSFDRQAEQVVEAHNVIVADQFDDLQEAKLHALAVINTLGKVQKSQDDAPE